MIPAIPVIAVIPVIPGMMGRTMSSASIAQLGERQTEDLKVPGSIPGLGTFFAIGNLCPMVYTQKRSASGN